MLVEPTRGLRLFRLADIPDTTNIRQQIKRAWARERASPPHPSRLRAITAEPEGSTAELYRHCQAAVEAVWRADFEGNDSGFWRWRSGPGGCRPSREGERRYAAHFGVKLKRNPLLRVGIGTGKGAPMWHRSRVTSRKSQVFFGLSMLLAAAILWYAASALFLWISSPPLETTGALSNGAPVTAEPK